MLPDGASPDGLVCRASTLLRSRMEQMLLLLLLRGSMEINNFHVQILLRHYITRAFNTH